MEALKKFCQTFGLHPLTGFGMFAVDWMLFAPEAGSLGTALVFTVPFALALTIPCVLIQKHSFNDDWGAALGKGIMVGVLTAIPSPLPSVVSLTAGALGIGKLLMKDKSES
jgi:hypothetical protein